MAEALDRKYSITESVAWLSNQDPNNDQGAIGEYLALEDASTIMGPGDESDQVTYWHNVQFLGTCYHHQTGNDALFENSILGEVDLMQVRKSEEKIHCIGIGNVKVGSAPGSDARKQNECAIALLTSFIKDQRCAYTTQSRKQKWPHVARITCLADGEAQEPPQRTDLVADPDHIKQVTIGAKGKSGFNHQLGYTVAEIQIMAKHLRGRTQKKEK